MFLKDLVIPHSIDDFVINKDSAKKQQLSTLILSICLWWWWWKICLDLKRERWFKNNKNLVGHLILIMVGIDS